MDKQYYVQVIANNYLKNVVDDPENIKVHSRFLQGEDNERFEKGFLALLALTRNLYSDIARDPEPFGMLLKENTEQDAKNTDYTNSNASFVRVPNLLLAIGVTGVVQADGSLLIEGRELLNAAKELKITNLTFLLGKLKEYGFETSGHGKTVKAEDGISVSYPDSPGLAAALKAMSEALLELNKGELKKSKNYFYMMHNGLLEHEKVKEPKLTIDAMIHTLDKVKRENAADLHDFIAPSSKPAVRMGGFMRNDWSCVYTNNKNKKVIMSMHTVQDKLSIKLNLQHIGEYMDTVMDCPEPIRETIRSSGWPCGHCNEKCSGGFAFEMDGDAYNKCRCGSFMFENTPTDSMSYYKALLERELVYRD